MLANKLKAFVFPLFFACALIGCADKSDKLIKSTSGFVQIEQGKLFYQAFGSGAPIIVLHGGPGLDQTYLQPQMLALAKTHKIIFYDQRGSGQSLATKLNPALINIPQFVKDLEALRIQLGFNQFILLGHSWGGLLAMNYATVHPDRVSALILMSSAPADFKGQQAFLSEFFKRTAAIKTEIQPLFDKRAFEKLTAPDIQKLYHTLFTVYFYHPDDVQQLTLNMSAESAKRGAAVMSLLQKTPISSALISKLKTLSIPTLLIHGKQDIVPLQTAETTKNAIPHAKLSVLNECGHFPYIEQPKKTFSEIEAFLQASKASK